MNYKEIESFKYSLLNLVRKGCQVHIPEYGVRGRIIGVGFKPYWTNPVDSKIEKLEFNILDNHGRLIPFNFFNVIGYNIVSYDGRGIDEADNLSIDIHVYSPNKANEKEPGDKVRVDITSIQKK